MGTSFQEFLGAILGAWIGISTEIWNQPTEKIIVFVASFAIISLLLDIVGANYDSNLRLIATVTLVILGFFTGAFLASLKIFKDERQITFYYVVVIAWFFLSIATPILHKKLNLLQLKIQLVEKATVEKQ